MTSKVWSLVWSGLVWSSLEQQYVLFHPNNYYCRCVVSTTQSFRQKMSSDTCIPYSSIHPSHQSTASFIVLKQSIERLSE
jgi:hypothetical protein